MAENPKLQPRHRRPADKKVTHGKDMPPQEQAAAAEQPAVVVRETAQEDAAGVATVEATFGDMSFAELTTRIIRGGEDAQEASAALCAIASETVATHAPPADAQRSDLVRAIETMRDMRNMQEPSIGVWRCCVKRAHYVRDAMYHVFAFARLNAGFLDLSALSEASFPEFLTVVACRDLRSDDGAVSLVVDGDPRDGYSMVATFAKAALPQSNKFWVEAAELAHTGTATGVPPVFCIADTLHDAVCAADLYIIGTHLLESWKEELYSAQEEACGSLRLRSLDGQTEAYDFAMSFEMTVTMEQLRVSFRVVPYERRLSPSQ